MTEAFKADPKAISGLGNLISELSANAIKSSNLVKNEAGASGEFKGLMDKLRPPVDALHDATVSRQNTLSPSIRDTGIALKQTAWKYTSTEDASATAFAHTTTREYVLNPLAPPIDIYLGNVPTVQITTVDDVPGATTFRSPEDIDVSAPGQVGVDWNSLVRESAEWLADADSAIFQLSRWSPIQQALEPVAGNWMDLKRIGQVYGKSGNAFDAIANDLTDSYSAIDPHWDGAAAQAYATFNTNMARGLAWEGSSGRLLDKGLTMAADKLQDAAKAVIELVKRGLS